MKLSEQKGTPVRLRLLSGEVLMHAISPLQHGASALQVEADGSRVSLRDSEDNETLSLTVEKPIDRIEALVLYPDGRTWEGPIAPGKRDIRLVVWDPAYRSDLLQEGAVRCLSAASSWKENATTAALTSQSTEPLCGCAWVTCPDPV